MAPAVVLLFRLNTLISRRLSFGFIHLADRLENLLGRKVDLVAADGIKDNRRPLILSSLVDVAP